MAGADSDSAAPPLALPTWPANAGRGPGGRVPGGRVPGGPGLRVVRRTGQPADRAALAGPERLAEFFAPRSIALVGASEDSGWARYVLAAAAAAGFTGDLIPVHHTRRRVFGRPVAAKIGRA